MRILGIDPGATCGMVWLDDGVPFEACQWEPERTLGWLRMDGGDADGVVVEGIESFGMAVGREVFETAYLIGRMQEIAQDQRLPLVLIGRKQVKLTLCGSPRAKDANIRAAIIDRFGGKAQAIGNKKNPGPLYGVKGHAWSALAVALTYLDSRKETSTT